MRRLSVFADDTTTVPPGTSRLVLRHTAATEDVNVLLNAQAVSTGEAVLEIDGPVIPAGVDAENELDVPPDARTA
jgi:hypothetical protein